MRALMLTVLALGLLGLSACTSSANDENKLGVSPVVPHQIEGGRGWR